MSFLEVIRSALRGMASNKLRSFLTLLGVLIGAGSVILLVGVGNGAAQDVTEQIGSLGSQQLTVRASSSGGSNATRSQSLTMESVRALEESERGEHIDTVVPQGSSSATLSVGTTSTSASIISTTPYLVNGVLAAKDDSGMTSTNNVAVMPLTRLERSLAGYGALSTITLTATTSEDVTEAQTEATIILSEQLGVSSSDDAPFTIRAQSQLLSAQSSATDTFTSMLAAVAALSLVVGGIGVTNIMLVTVTERTREIGIRKALGARRGTILTQFLIEATLLSLLGGAIGVIFGGYPALRASRMRPVDALRHD